MAEQLNLPRRLALDVLLRFEKSGSQRLKADSLTQEALARHADSLSDQDRAYTHALVMGTLRHWLRLDEWIKLLTGRSLKQITPPVRVLLRLGLFQLYGLSQVPAYAAINTTVELAKASKQGPKTIKFINAVLRSAQRKLEAEGFGIDEVSATLPERLLWQFGWASQWTARLQATYPDTELLAMAEASQTPPNLVIRVNTLKTTVEAYIRLFSEANVQALPVEGLPEGLELPDFSGSPRQLPGYVEGLFYVQDPSSMWVSRLLDPQSGERVLDLCAAPGSKTTHMAALMQNTGRIVAIESKQERLRLLEENIDRLNVTVVEAISQDGLSYESSEGFDKVLVDAPCSGSGTLRRHPELLLQLRKLDVLDYQRQQKALLAKGFECLKPGGVLVYSTCSILPAENHELVADFVAGVPAAILETEEQRLICKNADGFYAARIIKKG